MVDSGCWWSAGRGPLGPGARGQRRRRRGWRVSAPPTTQALRHRAAGGASGLGHPPRAQRGAGAPAGL
eukprot:scaffold2295_cov354-Prasinococcus_capsulatus_cf.AAC.21